MTNKDTALDGRVVAFGYVYLTAQNIISTFIGVLGYSFLTRSVSQVDVGALAGLTLLATFLQILSDLGLSSSLAKFVSELKGRGEGAASYLISAITFRGVIASTLSLLLLITSEWFSTLLFKTTTYSPAIRLLSLDLLLISLTPILNSFLLGAGRLKAIAFCGVASTSARWASITILLLKGLGVQGVVLGWIIGDLLGLALYSICVSKSEALGNLSIDFTKTISTLLKFSTPLYAASLVSFLYSYYDRAIILAFLPLSDLGVYDVASKVFSVLVAFATPLSSALFPYYGSAYGRSDHNSVSSTITRASKYSALIFAPLALGLFSLSKPVITLFAGQQYESGYTVLSTLSIFALVYTISPALSNLLLIYGKTLTILLLSLIPVAVSLSTIPLIWYLGLNGLALMKGLSILISFTLTLYVLSSVVKIRLDKPALTKIYTSSTIMTLTILLIEQTYYSKYLLPLYITLGAAIYIISLRLLKVIDEQDLNLLKQVFGAKLSAIITKALYHTTNKRS